MKSRKGFTLIELLVVVAIIALLISILLPSLARARELSKRTVCMANLKGIGNASHIYSNENDDLFPIAPHDITNNNYIAQIGVKGSAGARGAQPAIDDPFLTTGSTTTSTTANLWILVGEGGTAPGSFHCPSSTDERDLTERVSAFLDFTGFNTVSYGFQVPFGAGATPGNQARPTNSVDPRIGVAADKGPYSEPGGSNGQSDSGQTGLKDKLASPSGGSCGGSYPTPNKPTDCYRPWNSPNHGGRGDGEGQNILYADAHAEWQRKPEAGAENDNIYTCGPWFPSDNNLTPPTGMDYPGFCNRDTSQGRNPNIDTLIYP